MFQNEKNDLNQNAPAGAANPIKSGHVPGGSFSSQAGSPNFSAIGPDVTPDPWAGKQKWCYKQTSVFSSIDAKVSPLVAGRIVTIKQGGVKNVPGDNLGRSWSLIDGDGNAGWVDELYLDNYNQESDYQVSIPNQTPSPYDAQQYMIWDGKAKFNMCGELCVAFVVGDDLGKVLNTWKGSENVQRYNNYVGMDKPTGIEDLKSILKAYGYNLDTTVSDDVKGFTSVDAGQMAAMLNTHLLIALVKINKAKYGMLVPKQGSDVNEIDHWVVVNSVSSKGTRVQVYNPFSNRLETYSYREFFKSVTGPSLVGSWVRRKRSIPSPTDEVQEQSQAGAANLVQGQQVKDPSRAAQYILVNGQEKHELCGEFSVAYILTQSLNCARDYAKNGPDQATLREAYGIASDTQQAGDGFSIFTMLTHWQKKQPNLYNYYVGQDHPTDRLTLKSILLEYGYSETDFDLFPGSSFPSAGQIKERL
ncbi:MAG: hypothetical protein ACM3XO_25250, partial [Bacteroidota bacterium]